MLSLVRISSAWSVPLAATAFLLVAMHPAIAGSEIAGRWTGMAEQSDGQSYPAVMEFDQVGHGRSDYPSLDCSGKLSGAGTKGIYQFRETILTEGRAGAAGRCVDGTIRLTVSGNVMKWSWSGEWKGKPITASGTFLREGGGS